MPGKDGEATEKEKKEHEKKHKSNHSGPYCIKREKKSLNNPYVICIKSRCEKGLP